MRRFSRWRDDEDDEDDDEDDEDGGGGSNSNLFCCEEDSDDEGGVKIMSRRMSTRGAEGREPNEEEERVVMVRSVVKILPEDAVVKRLVNVMGCDVM